MCRCSQRGGNKGCCCRLMPAQLWHAPTWAVGAGGAHTRRGGPGRGISPQWMYKEVYKGCAAPGCWRFLYSSCCSREVWLSAGTCGVSIPGGTGGVEGCLGQSGWRGLGGTRWRWLGDRRELWLQHGGFGWETQSAIPRCALGVWGLVSLLGICRDGNG